MSTDLFYRLLKELGEAPPRTGRATEEQSARDPDDAGKHDVLENRLGCQPEAQASPGDRGARNRVSKGIWQLFRPFVQQKPVSKRVQTACNDSTVKKFAKEVGHLTWPDVAEPFLDDVCRALR